MFHSRPTPVGGLEYARKLYGNIGEWYKDVHTRAQLVLSLDGAFVTLLAGSILGNRDEIKSATDVFGWETWVLLALMALAFATSLFYAIQTLTPRSLFRRRIDAAYTDIRGDLTTPPPPEVMWWPQFIWRVGWDWFHTRVETMTGADERDALSSQIFALSDHLNDKYRFLHRAYIGAGLAVVLLLAASASFVFHVARSTA
jgi:hypothetical protein